MQPKYIQVNCREANKVDLHQAKAVLKYKPDIIIFEYPNSNKTPNLLLNKYKPANKPRRLIDEVLKKFPPSVIKKIPWVKSDITTWNNIAKLWSSGHQTLVYFVDAPSELLKARLGKWEQGYPAVMKNWLWWVPIYLREKMMARNIKWVLDNYKTKPKPVVLIFLQSFHWQHVKFLMQNPKKDEIWRFYFKKFPQLDRATIGQEIKKFDKIFYKYWRKVSDF